MVAIGKAQAAKAARDECAGRLGPRAGRLPAAYGGVELGHELAVGCAGGGEFPVAFFKLELQVDGLLLQVGDLVVEGVGVGGRAEP